MKKYFSMLIICLAIGRQVWGQSVFEAHVGWSSPDSPAVLNVGMVWFRVQNDLVEFQAVLQDPVGQTPSLQPLLILPGNELSFSFGTGQHFAMSQGFRYQNPFTPAPPFDPNAPLTDNYFEGTSFRGSFQAFPGFENQLLSQGATLQVTLNGNGFDNSIISGELAFVPEPVPEPSAFALVGVSTLMLYATRRKKFGRKQVSDKSWE